MGTARVDFGGSDRVTDLVAKLNKQIGVLEDKLKAVTKESKISTREGQKLWESTRTPLEKYNKSVERANQLLKAGVIDQQTYGRAVDKAKDALNRQGKAAKQAFGGEAKSELQSYISQMATLSAGIASATRLFTAMAAARREAAEPFAAAGDSRARLAQLSQGDPEKFRRIAASADSLFRAGSTDTLDQSTNLAFAIDSADASGELPFLKRLAASRTLGNLSQVLPAATAFRKNLSTAGSLQDTLSLALGASANSPAQAQRLLKAAAKGAGSAGQLGVGPGELLGATALAVSSTGDEGTGATILAALLRKLEKNPELSRRISSEGFVGGLSSIGAQFGTGARLSTALGGDSEAIRGFRALAGNADDLSKAINESRAARRSDLVTQGAEIVEADPISKALAASRRARARRILSGRSLGLDEFGQTAEKENILASLRESGASQVTQVLASGGASIGGLFGQATLGARIGAAIEGAVLGPAGFIANGSGASKDQAAIQNAQLGELRRLNQQQSTPQPAIER